MKNKLLSAVCAVVVAALLLYVPYYIGMWVTDLTHWAICWIVGAGTCLLFGLVCFIAGIVYGSVYLFLKER